MCVSSFSTQSCEACCLAVGENRVADTQVHDLSGHHLEILNNAGTRTPSIHGRSQRGADFLGTQGVDAGVSGLLLAGRAT